MENKFNEGDIVFDTLYREIFKFKASRDKFAVATSPNRFRIATPEEIEQLGVVGREWPA